MVPAMQGTLRSNFAFVCLMAREIAALIAQTNDLQRAVDGMRLLRRKDETVLKDFLSSLHALDFQFLLALGLDRKLLYLERRFESYVRPRRC
jgi:hypothetical protein